MASPYPIPTAIKEAEGWACKEKKPVNEPKPTQKASIVAPTWLTPDAKALWKKLIKEYQHLGVYAVDVPCFAMYCDAVATYIRLRQEIHAEGEVVQGINKAGQPYSLQSPKCSLMHQAFMRMQRLGAEIGHSPASRARLGRLNDEDEDDLDEMIKTKPKK